MTERAPNNLDPFTYVIFFGRNRPRLPSIIAAYDFNARLCGRGLPKQGEVVSEQGDVPV